MFSYVKANEEKLNQVWDLNIQNNPGDARWIRWKERFVRENKQGITSTYLVLCDDVPVGEGSVLWETCCYPIKGREQLATKGKVCNINGLRIIKQYEGQGHISKLFKLMESEAKDKGYEAITIGVEACEARNLAIYLHLGYTQLVHHEIEDGALVLYYQKVL